MGARPLSHHLYSTSQGNEVLGKGDSVAGSGPEGASNPGNSPR